MHRIEADLLIPGHGGPLRDGVVVLDGSRIGYAGPAGVAPPTPGAPVTRAAAVMPGMWECHGHLIGTRTFDLDRLPLEPEALRARSGPGGARSRELYPQREVDLVVQRDAVVSDPRDLGFLLPGPVDRARSQLGEPEPAALVEAERVDVVVRRGAP